MSVNGSNRSFHGFKDIGGTEHKNTPHIKNIQVGVEKWEPMYESIFDVVFTMPPGLAATNNDKTIALMPQCITDISGLDSLQKIPPITKYKYMGVEVAFANPTLDSNGVEITIQFNLNLDNSNTPAILIFFKEWAKLMYNIATNQHSLKQDYVASTVTIREANRRGDVWRQIILKNVILTAFSGLDTLSYESNNVRKLSVTLYADYYDEQIASWNTLV